MRDARINRIAPVDPACFDADMRRHTFGSGINRDYGNAGFLYAISNKLAAVDEAAIYRFEARVERHDREMAFIAKLMEEVAS